MPGAPSVSGIDPDASFARAVTVRYDWTGLRGTTVRVRFDNAITVNTRPVDVSAVEIRVL